MTQGDRRLHAASSRFLVGHGLARALHYLCTGRACSTFQSRRGLRHLFVGAYGVVGGSGVKDARKSVLIADALASADQSAPRVSPTGRRLDRWGANGVEAMDKRGYNCQEAIAYLGIKRRAFERPAPRVRVRVFAARQEAGLCAD